MAFRGGHFADLTSLTLAGSDNFRDLIIPRQINCGLFVDADAHKLGMCGHKRSKAAFSPRLKEEDFSSWIG